MESIVPIKLEMESILNCFISIFSQNTKQTLAIAFQLTPKKHNQFLQIQNQWSISWFIIIKFCSEADNPGPMYYKYKFCNLFKGVTEKKLITGEGKFNVDEDYTQLQRDVQILTL